MIAYKTELIVLVKTPRFWLLRLRSIGRFQAWMLFAAHCAAPCFDLAASIDMLARCYAEHVRIEAA